MGEGPCLDLVDGGLQPTVVVAVVQDLLERPNDYLEVLSLPRYVVIRPISRLVDPHGAVLWVLHLGCLSEHIILSVFELLHTLGVKTTPKCRAETEATLTLRALKHEVVILLLVMLGTGRGRF